MMCFSSQYHKREEYLKKSEVPTFSEVRRQLGDSLAEVFFTLCPDSLKDEMSLSRKLSGPGKMLWISPSDLLIGKVVLKPPLTAKHMKALTHEGILNLGEKMEAQWLAAVELEKLLALENLEELLMLLAARDKERSIADALSDRDAEFQKYLAKLNREFDEQLQAQLAQLRETLETYYENLIEERLKECMSMQAQYLADKIEEAVDAIVQELTEKFIKDLEEQEAELENIWLGRLQGQAERFKMELAYQEEVFVTVMKQLKHNLQCNNISSLMYVLCMERRKCLQEQQTIVDSTSAKIYELEQKAEESSQQIEKLQKELENKQRQLTVREDCLLGVITQFQKFINYALRAVPTQAEFLISVEKMMTFELCQSLIRTQHGRRTHLAKMIMPWKTVSEVTLPPTDSLTDQNGHNCLNELRMPICPHEEDSDRGSLYAMTYRDHTYIREDFRNRVTQGLFRRTSSAVWSKNIEDLVHLIKNVNQDELDIMDAAESIRSPNQYSLSGNSSVHFLRDSVGTPDTVGLLAVRDSVVLQKSRNSAISYDDISLLDAKRSSQGVALLAVTDSLTLLKEKLLNTADLEKDTEELPPESEPLPEPKKQDIPLKVSGDSSLSYRTVVHAPSTATIQLNRRLSHRQTSLEHSDSIFRKVSEATIRLNKQPKTSQETLNMQKPSMSTVRLATKESSRSKPKRAKRIGDSYCSRLSQHRDSLEIIAESIPKKAQTQKVKNIIKPVDVQDSEYPTQQFVINAPSETSRDFPDVNFKKIAEAFNELYLPEKPWKIYPKKDEATPIPEPKIESRTNFLKQSKVAKIIGASSSEVNRNTKDFTVHRIHSLIDILKKDDSLIRMFTRCGQ